MRCIASYDERAFPPRLALTVFGAPHRRMRLATILAYRVELRKACIEAGMFPPIRTPIDLSVVFVDPTSPDLDNLLAALCQALDGKTLGPNSVLADDGLISKVEMMKIFQSTTDRVMVKAKEIVR